MELQMQQPVSKIIFRGGSSAYQLYALQTKIKKCNKDALPYIYSPAFESSIAKGMRKAREEGNSEFLGAVVAVVGLPEDIRERGAQRLGELEFLSRQTFVVQTALEKLGITAFSIDKPKEAILKILDIRQGHYDVLIELYSRTAKPLPDKDLLIRELNIKLRLVDFARERLMP